MTIDDLPCASCGAITPLRLLDAKPIRLTGVKVDAAELSEAADQLEDIDALECVRCYGPSYLRAHRLENQP